MLPLHSSKIQHESGIIAFGKTEFALLSKTFDNTFLTQRRFGNNCPDSKFIVKVRLSEGVKTQTSKRKRQR